MLPIVLCSACIPPGLALSWNGRVLTPYCFAVTSVLAIGGIGGLAIGLAGREICENLLNGFLIMSTVRDYWMVTVLVSTQLLCGTFPSSPSAVGLLVVSSAQTWAVACMNSPNA
jgi:hypothetical protein